MINIFFDLDGTLIDSKLRLYKLFQFLINESKLSFNEYWELKKNKIGHEKILTDLFNYDTDRINNFKRKWLLLIENEELLSYDTPFEGVTPFLNNLNTRSDKNLFIVTARQFKQKTFTQIESFGWDNIFRQILVTCAKHEKHSLINCSIKISNSDWFIGDTGKDIQTGKVLGINTCAVLSGFLSEEKLLEYQPDLIINNVVEFKLDNFIKLNS